MDSDKYSVALLEGVAMATVFWFFLCLWQEFVYTTTESMSVV